MTGDQTNPYQSAVAVGCLFMTPSHNWPSYAEQKARSYLAICEWLKNLERMAFCRGYPNLLNQ